MHWCSVYILKGEDLVYQLTPADSNSVLKACECYLPKKPVPLRYWVLNNC